MKQRLRAPLSAVMLVAFVAGLFPQRTARANDSATSDSPAPVEADTSATSTGSVATSAAATPAATPSTNSKSDNAPSPVATSSPLPNGPLYTSQLPNGADKSGVTSQQITVPQGAGKIQGMGESFSAQLSTGIATYSIPISLPAARGGAQPSLALSYSSSLGHGVAGLGWEIGVPFIARQTDRGIPHYDDPVSGGPWKPTMDRFAFNGGQELVPICLVDGSLGCTGALSGEVMPVWSTGHLYFRVRVEGSYLRFFWSPDHQTWRVQDKSGRTMELGVPLDAPGTTDGLERDPAQPSHVYRWSLVRQYDAQGAANPASGAPLPNNVVRFRYTNVEGTSYLTDIWDTPPAQNVQGPTAEYAHHTRLTYAIRTDPTTGYKTGYRARRTLRLTTVDVASKTLGGTGARELLRRYHLVYDAAYHPSLLTTVQLEGRCAQGIAEDGGEGFAPGTNCPTLPPITLSYEHVAGYDINGVAQDPTLQGFEASDERVKTMGNSPKHSIDEALTDLFDVNSDGLPDVLTTAPGLYQGNHAVFFNGSGGTKDLFSAAQLMAVHGVLGANAGIISLDNSNVSDRISTATASSTCSTCRS
ncbi:hypothetical protein BH09MYX1_BH09MYX1_43580 [soil metagenome]